MIQDEWNRGDQYQNYVGRWSRKVVEKFIPLLDVSPGARWLDVGCGTGMLTSAILQTASPALVRSYDSSPVFVEYARHHIQDPLARFEVGDAHGLPEEPDSFNAAVSGLVLNFLADPLRAVKEKSRLVKPGGKVGAYVWDYAGEMQFMRYFWDAAISINPEAVELDEGVRFPLCRPESLEALFRLAGIQDVKVLPIDIDTVFQDFDDYWNPFLGGQGPAPGYLMSLPEHERSELRTLIHDRLPVLPDGSIHLIARAWAILGTVV